VQYQNWDWAKLLRAWKLRLLLLLLVVRWEMRVVTGCTEEISGILYQ